MFGRSTILKPSHDADQHDGHKSDRHKLCGPTDFRAENLPICWLHPPALLPINTRDVFQTPPAKMNEERDPLQACPDDDEQIRARPGELAAPGKIIRGLHHCQLGEKRALVVVSIMRNRLPTADGRDHAMGMKTTTRKKTHVHEIGWGAQNARARQCKPEWQTANKHIESVTPSVPKHEIRFSAEKKSGAVHSS